MIWRELTDLYDSVLIVCLTVSPHSLHSDSPELPTASEEWRQEAPGPSQPSQAALPAPPLHTHTLILMEHKQTWACDNVTVAMSEDNVPG